ncbi:MAG: 4Fe-4S binding protein [Candidatus Cloacimonetes bacterium]|nr:4Fe-4S binding protein [Candidatus Cloacimonadota bacterium]
MKVNSSLCDICGTCVAVCPVDAIRVSEFCVHIEMDVCTQCGNCLQVCPARAITVEGDAS